MIKTKRLHSQSGFTMPLAVGMGLVMIIVAASTIGRSQSDRATTSSQRESNRVLSISEAGIVRVRSFLDRHKILATKNLNTWTNTIDNLPADQSSCRLINPTIARQQALLYQNNTWIDLDSSNSNKGRYRVIDYQYRDGIGKLTVSARIDTNNTTQNIANSTLTVNMPIGSAAGSIAPPALWARSFNLNTAQKITGQIRAVNCPQLANVDPDGITGVDPNNISLISNIPSGEIIADPFTNLPPAKVAPNTAISLPAITTSIVLPRPNSIDLPDANGEYHYLVDIDNSVSNHSIKLQDLDRIELAPAATNRKINLYLKGNIDLAGSQTLNVNTASPNLRIYGSPQTVKMTINDTAEITAFIHAPAADVTSIKSNSSPTRNIIGAVWVNSWDSATNASVMPIVQSGNWEDFGIASLEQPSQINPIGYWQRASN